MAKLKESYSFDWHRIYAEDRPHIEYSITDICNRNCRSCSHLAPLAKRANFVTEGEFTRIVDIMRRLMPDIHTFWLTGGEPTLHPHYINLLKILRRKYPDTYVGIYTNGITLRRHEEDEIFWKFIREEGIVWGVTNYETPREYFEKLFSRNGCANNLAFLQSRKTFVRLVNYSEGREVTKDKYLKCGWERSKINIRGGKIYNCPSSEFADLYNEYFSEKLVLTEKDFLVVDDVLTRERIEAFRGPMPFCSYCDISRRQEIFKNEPSSQKREEWA